MPSGNKLTFITLHIIQNAQIIQIVSWDDFF